MKFKVPIDEYQCCTAQCPFEKECAQHASAGDFRSEGGFQPEFQRALEELVCLTYSQPVVEEEFCGKLPANYDSLQRGCLDPRTVAEEAIYEI